MLGSDSIHFELAPRRAIASTTTYLALDFGAIYSGSQ